MENVLPILLQKLSFAFPRIKIEAALSGNQEEVIASLQSGRSDFAFAASPKIKSITAEAFHHDPIRLAVSKKHPLAMKRIIGAQELRGLRYCLPVKADRLRGPIERFLKRLVEHPSILIETNDYALMRNMIGEGICA